MKLNIIIQVLLTQVHTLTITSSTSTSSTSNQLTSWFRGLPTATYS